MKGSFGQIPPSEACKTAPETAEIKGSSDDGGGERRTERREPGEVDGVLVNNA